MKSYWAVGLSEKRNNNHPYVEVNKALDVRKEIERLENESLEELRLIEKSFDLSIKQQKEEIELRKRWLNKETHELFNDKIKRAFTKPISEIEKEMK